MTRLEAMYLPILQLYLEDFSGYLYLTGRAIGLCRLDLTYLPKPVGNR